MQIERIQLNDRMSMASKYNGILFLSGVTSQKGTFEEQVQDVLEEIERRLNICDSDRHHILRVHIFLKDMFLFDRMNAVYDKWVSKKSGPARICVRADMARESALIEIAVDAVVVN